MKEALKLALETLESSRVFVMSREMIKQPEGADWYDNRITAIKEALAQPEQEPWLLETTQALAKALAREFYPEVTQWECLDDLAGVISQIDNMTTGLMRKPVQPDERNFCPRCGKRTADLTLVHTCTPPIAADPKAFHGFPSGSVSTPNAGGKCVTAGETASIAELWAALTAYQPHADTCGHGKSWRKMCEAQTKDAAGVAASHAVVYASSTNVAADAAHIVWAGGDLGVAIAKIKSITR